MTLDVSCERNEQLMVVSAKGEMDYHNFKVLRSSVEQALADGDKNFILNLVDIAYLDSSALGSLLSHQKKIRDRDGGMVVIPSPALSDILNLTHLDSYFTLVDSVEAGREWFDR